VSFSQKLFSSYHGYTDPDTRIGELNRIWYDSVNNVFRIQLDKVTPGGTVIGGGGSTDLSGYATLTTTQTLTNKTLTSPNITDGVFSNTFTIGTQVFYAHTNGFSVNENFDITDPYGTQANFTGYHYTSGSGKTGVAFTLARTGYFTDGFGITGDASNNQFVIGSETANTDYVFKTGIGMPFDVSGGTTIFTINRDGSIRFADDTLQTTAGMIYKGSWNANTNTPTLSANQAGAVRGDVYITSTAGTHNIGSGSQEYYAGDLLIYDGTHWNDIPGNTGSVTSFNTRTGVVTLTSTDVTTALGYTPLQYTSLSAETLSAGVQSLTYNNSTGKFSLTPYLLPTASTTQLGGVKVDGTTITINAGVISSTGTGTVIFKGSWNANTNTPTLSANQVGAQSGWEYIVTVAGTRNLGNGSVTFNVGDLVIYDGTTWNDIPGNAATVTSFNTRTGAVTLQSSDVTTALGFTPIQLSSLSVGTPNSASGSGAISYNNSTGEFKYTPPVIYSTLASLTDVNTTGVTNNQVLTYSTASSKWVAATPAVVPTYTVSTGSASGGGSLSLSGTTFTFNPAVQYTLPTASASVLGGVKVGTGLSIDGSGVLSSTITQYTLPTASTTVLGGVKVDGTTITINGSGVIQANYLATARNINGVAFDGSASITVTADATTLTGTTLNSTVVSSSLTSVGTLTGLTVSGTIAANGSSGITTTQTTFPLVNTTATTVNFAGAATTVSIGASTGKVTINSTDATSSTTTGSLVVKGGVGVGGGIYTGGLISANGAISSNSTITATGNLIAGNGILATPTTTGYVYNSVATTVNMGGGAGTINIGYNATTNLSGQLLVSYTGSGSSAGIAVSTSNTVGGMNYADFLKVTNTASGATNINKTFRLNSVGTLEILNSAYTATILSITDTGFVAINTATGVTNGVPTNNGIAMNSNSYIYDDGNYHLTSKSGNIWLNANDGSAVSINTQMPTGITGGGLNVQGAVKSLASGAAATSFISGAGAISGVALQLDSGTAGTAANMAVRDTSTVASTMYFDVSTGSTTNGTFKFRSSSSFNELMVLNNTNVTVNKQMLIGGGSQTAYVSINSTNSYNISGSYGYLGGGGAGSIGSGGNTGTVGFSLYCSGRIQSNEVDVPSDERLKDIQGTIPLDKALQFVRAIDGILYTWKPGFGDEGLKSGFSAQGVHKAGFDHMVVPVPNDRVEGSTDADGFTSPDKFQLTLNYMEAIPYHHEVIKHLLDRIEQLEATVAKLTADK